MYPHHVFDLEPAGTFGMYPICYWWVSGRYFQPEPAMYSRCFHRFPGPLAPSVFAFTSCTETVVCLSRTNNLNTHPLAHTLLSSSPPCFIFLPISCRVQWCKLVKDLETEVNNSADELAVHE